MTAALPSGVHARRSGGAPAERRTERAKLRVVTPVPRRSRAKLIAVFTVLVVFGALFVNATFHSVLVSGQEQLDRLNNQVQDQSAHNQRLRLRVAGLESPGRIVSAARSAGMITPNEITWIMPSGGNGGPVSSVSGTPTTAPQAGSSVTDTGRSRTKDERAVSRSADPSIGGAPTSGR